MPCDLSKVTDVIQTVLTIISILVAIWIPNKIKWEQEYSSLLDFYRSLDYAIAFQGVIQFFFNDCGRDMSRVKTEYKRRFIEEVESKPGDIDKENCLHFQRRVLAQFFWQLNECAKSFSIGKRRVTNDFTNAEAKRLTTTRFCTKTFLQTLSPQSPPASKAKSNPSASCTKS